MKHTTSIALPYLIGLIVFAWIMALMVLYLWEGI